MRKYIEIFKLVVQIWCFILVANVLTIGFEKITGNFHDAVACVFLVVMVFLFTWD